MPVTTADAWTFEPEAARRAARSASGARPRRLRTRRPDGGDSGRRRVDDMPARDAESGSRARSRDCLQDLQRLPRHRSDHAQAPRGRCRQRGRHERVAARRNRSHRNVDGRRLLRAWLLRPLASLERIRDRLDAVEELAFRSTERGKFRETLKSVHDLERLVARAALGTAGRVISSPFDSRLPRFPG